VRIPVRRDIRENRFEFDISLTDAETRKPVGRSVRFFWDIIHYSPQHALTPNWPETIDPVNVEKHPIGPQKKSPEILERLARGGSICVTAPRRFGKSTLVQFLRQKSEDRGFVAPPPFVCTNYYLGVQGIDYDRLWQDVSDQLQAMLGSSVPRPSSGELPSESAFDHVRTAARRLGKKGIVILFDEAQLFFPSKAGSSLGDVIKDRLERCWSSPDRPNMVQVMFGFIGLPSLPVRAGVNLILI
jgi:AAA domain